MAALQFTQHRIISASIVTIAFSSIKHDLPRHTIGYSALCEINLLNNCAFQRIRHNSTIHIFIFFLYLRHILEYIVYVFNYYKLGPNFIFNL